MQRNEPVRGRPGPRFPRFAAAVLASACILVLPRTASAQNPTTDSLRVQIRQLMLRVDSLRAALARIGPGGAPAAPAAEDPLARIRAAAAAAAAAADTTATPEPAQQTFVGRQRNLSATNPEISVSGDVFAFSRSDASRQDNFIAREFELSFVSNLDPFSRAKIFAAYHTTGGEILPFGSPEPPGTSDVAVEEGYVEWVGLAGGLSVELGKFRQRFGKLNRWHAHALPAQQLPLPIMAFLGEEGLAQTGVSAHWLAPVHGFGTWELWGELTRSTDEAAFGNSHGLSALGHLNGFWDLTPSTYLELGVSGLTGVYGADIPASGPLPDFLPDRNRLFGMDFTLDWRPPASGRYRQATLQGGAMLNRRVADDGTAMQAKGGFLIGEYKFATQWILGGRYEYTQNPDNPDEHSWLAGPSLTWWESEFVRLRTAYEVFRGQDRFGQFVLQATFAMGPHKHENY